ncbi:hypothetical protein [Streptomyces sp. NPDC005017]|uniref:hypothetical protein n=1 Tax=Streptomyces sp. NPDC005017 TaxID=3364706 RepID=UPI003688956A
MSQLGFEKPDPKARLRLAERKAALLDRIAIEEGRALSAQLRAEIEGPLRPHPPNDELDLPKLPCSVGA